MFPRILFFLILISLLPTAVEAHGILVSAFPAPNSVLAQPPQQLVLTFSEALAPRGNTIQLRDAQGSLVELGEVTPDSQDLTRLLISLPELTGGVYTVEYRVLSAVDGHFTLGNFVFGIGDAAALGPLLARVVAPGQDAVAIGVEAGLKWLGLLAQAAIIGGLAFGYFLWRGVYQSGVMGPQSQEGFVSRLKQSLLFAWLLLLFSHLGGFAYRGLQQASSTGSLAEGMASFFVPLLTNYGHIWILSLGLILFYRLILNSIRAENWAVMNHALFFGGLIVFTQGLAGHAAALPRNLSILGLLGQFLHIMAVSVWVGGLIQLAWNVPQTLRDMEQKKRGEVYAYLVPRFSTLALASVAVLVASGLLLAWLQVGDLQALFTTFYGSTLTIKSLLFLPLLALGAVNFLFLVPRILGERSRKGKPRTGPGLLVRTVRGEVLLASAVLTAAAILSSLPPASVASRLAKELVRPANDPQAVAILEKVDVAMNSLTTLREHQFLSDDAGNLVHTIFEYQAPDRFGYRVLEGGRGVTVGSVDYYRALGETSWRVVPRSQPFVFPNYDYAGRAMGAHIDEETELEGRMITVVGFWLDKDLEFEFELWVDQTTYLVQQLVMEGPNHHMLSSYEFNPLLEITTPQ